MQTLSCGILIDGHWGQYGIARMVDLATEFGYGDPLGPHNLWETEDIITKHYAMWKLASMAPSNSPQLTDDQEEWLLDSSDSVEGWLNEHVAAEGFSFGWFDGEFSYWLNSDWEEASY